MGSVARGKRHAGGSVLHAQRRRGRSHRPLRRRHARETRLRTSLSLPGRGAREKRHEEKGDQVLPALSGFVSEGGRQGQGSEKDRQALQGSGERKKSLKLEGDCQEFTCPVVRRLSLTSHIQGSFLDGFLVMLTNLLPSHSHTRSTHQSTSV